MDNNKLYGNIRAAMNAKGGPERLWQIPALLLTQGEGVREYVIGTCEHMLGAEGFSDIYETVRKMNALFEDVIREEGFPRAKEIAFRISYGYSYWAVLEAYIDRESVSLGCDPADRQMAVEALEVKPILFGLNRKKVFVFHQGFEKDAFDHKMYVAKNTFGLKKNEYSLEDSDLRLISPEFVNIFKQGGLK